MKKIILLFIIATCSSYAQDVDLANSVDYIRIQKNGESGFSRAFGLNSSNHMYIGSVEKTIGNIYFFNKGTNHLMTIKPDGNVGIGTTNPQQKLQIGNSGFTFHDGGHKVLAFNPHTTNIGQIRYDLPNKRFGLETIIDGVYKAHMLVSSNGNVIVSDKLGIGTTNPSAKLDITGISTDLPILKLRNSKWACNQRTSIEFWNGGLKNYPTSRIVSKMDGCGTQGEALLFETQTAGETNPTVKMTLKNNGNVGIGTKNPSEKLTVKGKILCGEVEVVMESTIPADYVFQKYYTGTSALKADYVMPSLEEVEAFTKANHHLPEVPSAATIKEEGLQLKEMTTLLLQKVEELTLYTIEQEKRIKSLEAKLVEKN